ncbi:MAG: sigma-54-dependent Fis family transcriptional regulator [Desulfobacterales bacterium]|nr:sigma-54-dependent Fis family transcriptional regulator [Desulfobacterales bacterium]
MADILVVDDDKGMREFLDIFLTQEGYQVTSAADGNEAIKYFQKNRFDLVITDLKMPKIDGIDLIKKIKEISPETMIIVITAYASGDTALTSMKEGAYDYIEKNFDIEDLKKIVRDALEKKGIKQHDAQFIQDIKTADCFGCIIGRSQAMLNVYAMIRKVSNVSANVLILGESGTGKELVAKAIHEQSNRKEHPLMIVNCGGIPEQLLESEMFGYMKGSFTGSVMDKPGLFEMAKGGTLFLDEIGELPLILQVKLLRAIQQKTFRRIGGSKDIEVDVRIIAATNQNLEKRVKEGTFREDLFYRLNVISIHVPPLRERIEDIPLLVKYFINKYSKEFNKNFKQISSYALELLMKYRFPGNVRELENIIEKSVALETSNIVLPDCLSDITQNNMCSHIHVNFPDQGIHLNDELIAFESLLIKTAIQKANGSKTKAAKLLDVSMDSLRYRLEKLTIC